MKTCPHDILGHPNNCQECLNDALRARVAELEAERTRHIEAFDRIRLEDLSAFDCKLVAAKAQGLIP